MNIGGFEIERKFLIAMPDAAWLSGLDSSAITQTYLLGDENTTERVRKRVYPDHTEYTHTVKMRLSAVRRLENESEISRAEYEALLTRADPHKHTIEKRRYCLPWGELVWEIDVFPFWDDRALAEIELTAEEQPYTAAPELHILREVSDDRRYTNAALALEIPMDALE